MKEYKDIEYNYHDYSDSKIYITLDIADINATTLKIKGEFLLGGNIEITVPTIYMKWPW